VGESCAIVGDWQVICISITYGNKVYERVDESYKPLSMVQSYLLMKRISLNISYKNGNYGKNGEIGWSNITSYLVILRL
jgi:hypothetical protein